MMKDMVIAGHVDDMDAYEAKHRGEPEQVDDITFCPACNQPHDYCSGHGQIGDPVGFEVLRRHDADDHEDCGSMADCRIGEREV